MISQNPSSTDTYRNSLREVKQNGLTIIDIKPEHLNLEKYPDRYFEIALEAVRKYGLALHYVKSEHLSSDHYYEIALAAVKQEGYALLIANPEHLNLNEHPNRYYAIALEAVKQSGRALQYVKPEHLSSDHYYEIALEAVRTYGGALEDVKPEHLNLAEGRDHYFEFALEAIKQNGLALNYVKPEDLNLNEHPNRYHEIALAAVKQNGFALQFVEHERLHPDQFHSIIHGADKMQKEACKQNNYKAIEISDIINMIENGLHFYNGTQTQNTKIPQLFKIFFQYWSVAKASIALKVIPDEALKALYVKKLSHEVRADIFLRQLKPSSSLTMEPVALAQATSIQYMLICLFSLWERFRISSQNTADGANKTIVVNLDTNIRALIIQYLSLYDVCALLELTLKAMNEPTFPRIKKALEKPTKTIHYFLTKNLKIDAQAITKKGLLFNIPPRGSSVARVPPPNPSRT